MFTSSFSSATTYTLLFKLVLNRNPLTWIKLVSVCLFSCTVFTIKCDDERVIFTRLSQASSGVSHKKGKLIPFPRPTQSLVYLEERGKTCTCYCTSMFVLVMHNRKIRNSSVIALPPPLSTQLQTNKQKPDKRNTHSSPAGEGGTL